MREGALLKQNAAQWQKFEALLEQRAGADPDALAELFVRVTDDLAYAKTFYPASSTTVYLNTLPRSHYAVLHAFTGKNFICARPY